MYPAYQYSSQELPGMIEQNHVEPRKRRKNPQTQTPNLRQVDMFIWWLHMKLWLIMRCTYCWTSSFKEQWFKDQWRFSNHKTWICRNWHKRFVAAFRFDPKSTDLEPWTFKYKHAYKHWDILENKNASDTEGVNIALHLTKASKIKECQPCIS